MVAKNNSRLIPALILSMLVLIAAAAVFAFMIKKEQTEQINKALSILDNSHKPFDLVENTLESLFIAENEFKEYALTYDKNHFLNYKSQIFRLVQNIDTLQSMVKVLRQEDEGQHANRIIDERSREAETYIRLKRLTDSIMVISANIEMEPFEEPDDVISLKRITPASAGIVMDTLGYTQTAEKRKKGLLGKIKTFLVGEEEKHTTSTTVVVKKGETAQQGIDIPDESDSTFSYNRFAEDIINKSNTYYQRQLKSQLQRRKRLRESEIRLVRLNGELMNEIRGILVSLKGSLTGDEGVSRSQSLSSIVRSANTLQTILLISLLGALVLAMATAWMIYQNRRYHAKIIESRQKALAEAAEKRKFLAYMSHEFRTPLSSVIGFAEQLEQANPNKEQKEYLSGIMASSEMLLTTVNDILDLSKLESGKMTFMSDPFLPDETINQLIRAFKGSASEKGLTIDYNPPRKDIALLGDEVRLRQILNNLMSNAIKYTNKGKIVIDSEIVNNETGGHWLTVKVKDSGIGISEENLSKIFDEYTRVHSETASRWVIGTGLGLPVTKRLVDALGGKIEVTSKAGRGSEFTVRLPYLHSDVDVAEKQTLGVTPNLADSGIKLLIADDNYFNVFLLKSILKRIGIEADVAENGKEALDRLNAGKYNMLLSDMYMPVLDGLELTRTIRRKQAGENKQLPVIMITGNVSEEAKVHMKEAGVSDYLFKPFHQADLLGLLAKYLN